MVDVARAAGVAVSTVSRVANADPRVGAELADRVRTAIDQLGWEADDRARHLRLGTSGTIGAVVGELTSTFLRAAERAARSVDLMILATSTENDDQLELEAVRSLCRRRVDGLIIEPCGAPATTAYLAGQIARGLSVVALDRPLPGPAPVSDAVIGDNAAGIRLAYDHLVGRGHEHLAYLGDDERLFTGQQRADAFRRCAAARSHDVRGRVSTGAVTPDRVARALDRVLDEHPAPTALITGNATATTLAFRHLGLGLAGLDLVGYDDVAFAAVLDPPRTVIVQDYAAMGALTLQMVTTRLADRNLPVRRAVVPVRLLDRGMGVPTGPGSTR